MRENNKIGAEGIGRRSFLKAAGIAAVGASSVNIVSQRAAAATVTYKHTEEPAQPGQAFLVPESSLFLERSGNSSIEYLENLDGSTETGWVWKKQNVSGTGDSMNIRRLSRGLDKNSNYWDVTIHYLKQSGDDATASGFQYTKTTVAPGATFNYPFDSKLLEYNFSNNTLHYLDSGYSPIQLTLHKTQMPKGGEIDLPEGGRGVDARSIDSNTVEVVYAQSWQPFCSAFRFSLVSYELLWLFFYLYIARCK